MSTWTAREHHRFEAAGQAVRLPGPERGDFRARRGVRRGAADAFANGRAPATSCIAAVPDVDHRRGARPSCCASRRSAEVSVPAAPTPKVIPLAPFPLTTMVLNVTNQCNLALHATATSTARTRSSTRRTARQPKFMSEETARAERGLHAQGIGRQQGRARDVLRRRNAAELPGAGQRPIAYARQRGAELGKDGRFQPDHERDAAEAGDHRVPGRGTTSASPFRSTARRRCRTSSASSTTAPAATTSWRRRSRNC